VQQLVDIRISKHADIMQRAAIRIAPFHSTSAVKRGIPYCSTTESLHCLSPTLYNMKAEVAFYVLGVEKRGTKTGTMQKSRVETINAMTATGPRHETKRNFLSS
jgi:hypothetical protein